MEENHHVTNNTWPILKFITKEEIESQQLGLLKEDVDGHIFKVASKKEIDSIEQGNRVSVTLLDVETSENKCIGFIQKLNGIYMLGWNEVLQMRNINAGDLIGLQCASSSNTFKFILVEKGMCLKLVGTLGNVCLDRLD